MKPRSTLGIRAGLLQLPAILGLACAPAFADLPDLIYTFDTTGGEQAFDDSGNGADLKLPTFTTVSDEQAKFGPASLKVGGEKTLGHGWTQMNEPAFLFDQPIRKFSVTCWLRPSQAKRNHLLFRRHQRTPVHSAALRVISGVLTFTVDKEGKSGTVKTLPIPEFVDGEWTHFAATYDAGRVVLYVNGEVVTDETLPEHTELPVLEARPAFSSLVNAPNGTFMDDFALFGRVLDNAEVRRIHDKGLKAFMEEPKP